MRICVADDEKQVREGIIHKLRDCHPYAEVFDVGFGQSALDKIFAVQPDLLFVDIRMPEMDGLAILQAVKRFRPRTEVIVLTGYGDFEYARAALQGGALDYMLKPADRGQMRRLASQVYESMFGRFAEQLGRLLRQSAWSSAVSPVFHGGNLSLWFDERVGKTIQFRESAGGGEAVGPSGGESPIGTIAFEFGEAVIVSSASNPSGTVFFRTEEFPEIWSAEYSSWETKIFFGVQPDLAVNPVKEVSSEANQARRQILYAVKEANQEQLERSADLWLNALEGLRVELLRRECAKLLSLLDEGLLGEAAETQFAGPVRDRAADIAPKRAWPELRAWLRGTLLEYLPPGKKAESGSRAATWEEIIQLLEDGESPGLSLEEAAARAGIHPVTFSRLFKQRIGVNFVRYMVDRRMNRASFLLLNRNDSVAAVAAAVGYADLRHFSHLFKRAFGMTPGEYRKHHGSTGKPR